jgi:benzoate-CoA ligase
MTENAAATILRTGVDRFPDKPALLFQDTALSYGQLDRNTRNVAAILARRGVRPKDMVAIHLPDCPAFVTAFLGAMLLGAVPVPIGMTVSAEDKEFILHDSEATLLMTLDPAASVAGVPTLSCNSFGPLNPPEMPGDIPPHPSSPDDFAYMLYTSGSTGRPKGVPHAHVDVLVPSHILGPALFANLADEVILSASKLSFSYGLMAQVGLGLACGASVVLSSDAPEAKRLLKLIAAQRPTVLFAVPTVYDMLLRTPETNTDLASLRYCISSGEALPAQIHMAWREKTGLNIIELIGSTETFTSFMATRPGVDAPGTLGSPIPNFDIQLIPGTGQGNGTGRLLVRGPGIAKAYWKRPERTATTMLGDGWLDSGDICTASGTQLRHIGRADDLFRTAGQWVAPAHVEACLREHPAVDQCAVVPCQVRGLFYPCAFVVTDKTETTLTGNDLIRHAKAHLPRHMCPVKVVFLAELPRTATGKIQRHKLVIYPPGQTITGGNHDSDS